MFHITLLALMGLLFSQAVMSQQARLLNTSPPQNYEDGRIPRLPMCGRLKKCELTVHVDWVRVGNDWKCGVVAVTPQLLNVHDKNDEVDIEWSISTKIPGDFVFGAGPSIDFNPDPTDPGPHFGAPVFDAAKRIATIKALKTRTKKIFPYNVVVWDNLGTPKECEKLDPVIVNRD